MRYGPKADVHSFGIVLWEMLAHRKPFGYRYPQSAQLFDAVPRGERPVLTEEMRRRAPEGFVQLMVRCWNPTPCQRPNFAEIGKMIAQCTQQPRSTGRARCETKLREPLLPTT